MPSVPGKIACGRCGLTKPSIGSFGSVASNGRTTSTDPFSRSIVSRTARVRVLADRGLRCVRLRLFDELLSHRRLEPLLPLAEHFFRRSGSLLKRSGTCTRTRLAATYSCSACVSRESCSSSGAGPAIDGSSGAVCARNGRTAAPIASAISPHTLRLKGMDGLEIMSFDQHRATRLAAALLHALQVFLKTFGVGLVREMLRGDQMAGCHHAIRRGSSPPRRSRPGC